MSLSNAHASNAPGLPTGDIPGHTPSIAGTFQDMDKLVVGRKDRRSYTGKEMGKKKGGHLKTKEMKQR